MTTTEATGFDSDDRLPVLQHDLVRTEGLKVASALVKVTLEMRGLLVLDGPSGTGKSSAAVWLARRHRDWQWAYLQVPHNVRFDELAAHVHKAITGQPAHGRVRDIQHENVRLMNRHKVAFIADEVQHAGTKGVQALRYLADLTAMGPTGAAPLLLVGHGALNAVSTAPEMLDRLTGTAEFSLLRGGALLEFVHTLHPRLAVTDDDTVMRLDRDCAGNGSLRSWHAIAGLLARVSPHEPPTRPVTRPEVATVARFRGGIAAVRSEAP